MNTYNLQSYEQFIFLILNTGGLCRFYTFSVIDNGVKGKGKGGDDIK